MRISTTMLESFRLYLRPEETWPTEETLLATIRREFQPTRQMVIGQAFGRILERPSAYRIDGGYCVQSQEFGDIILGDDVIGPALELIQPTTVFEPKGVKEYAGHEVVARADQLHGADLIETKTTFAGYNIERYLESAQWRYLADIFAVPRVTYQVYVLDEHSNGVIALKSLEIVPVYAYPTLHRACEALVEQFVAYIDLKDRSGLGLRAMLHARQRTCGRDVLC